jgi:hypothetical protein
MTICLPDSHIELSWASGQSLVSSHLLQSMLPMVVRERKDCQSLNCCRARYPSKRTRGDTDGCAVSSKPCAQTRLKAYKPFLWTATAVTGRPSSPAHRAAHTRADSSSSTCKSLTGTHTAKTRLETQDSRLDLLNTLGAVYCIVSKILMFVTNANPSQVHTDTAKTRLETQD